MIGRRHFLGLSALTGQTARETGKIEERFIASATADRTPRVGIVLSSFRGSTEHDGTPLKGLPAPRPVGAQGRLSATLNGETVMREEARTRYCVGQFRKPVELRPGENLLVFRLEAFSEGARLSVLLTGPRADGDTVEGIRWSA
jgi:hypothetical protein